MTSAGRKLRRTAAWAWLATAVLAIATQAAAQTDLNRLFPKVPAAGSSQQTDEEYDPAPVPPDMQPRSTQRKQNGSRPQPTRTSSSGQRADNNRAAPASYQGSVPDYQNPRFNPQGTGAGRPAQMSGQRTFPMSQPQDDPPRTARSAGSGAAGYSNGGMYERSNFGDPPPSQNSMNGNNGNPNASYHSPADNDRNSYRPSPDYGRTNNFGGPPSGMGFGGMNFGGMFGPMASRSPQPAMPGGMSMRGMFGGGNLMASNSAASLPASQNTLPEPIVTPDAVYLDVEPIKVGKPAGPTISMPGTNASMPGSAAPGNGTTVYQGPMTIDGQPMTEGRSYLPGGPIMGRTYDGYTNPQCNDCCGGGNCGGNCGPQCGDNCGMYGGCEEGYDCCGGCGPNYGPFNGPYGRPWVLAPIDWLFGGLWHCGPYRGACDPCANWWWGQDFTVFAGVHDFKSPVNIDGNSNFGFHEGVNWSMPFWHEFGLGAQVGFQATQNNFQSAELNLYDDYRKQGFLTAGLFHRPCDGQGWQYGVVFDWLHDEFYQEFDVGQLRGELSWLWDCQNEIGFWFAAGVMDSKNQHDRIFLGATEYEAIDQYALYYRRRFRRGGEGRLWGGFTGDSGGLIGADFRLPIAKAWAVETGFNYVIDQQNNNPLFHDETWNVGMNLVWYWGCNAPCRSNYRPLFNVADNGTLMVTRRGLIVP